jgi:hypothetical protein
MTTRCSCVTLVLRDELPRLLSRPLRVHWAGWETDTFRLQKAGWKISAEQDFWQRRMRLAMEHTECQMRGMSPYLDFEYEYAIRDPRYLNDIVFHVDHVMGREVRVYEHGRIEWAFQPIDAQPTFTENKISRIEDLAHFAAPLVKTREIIIPQDSVPELLERILKLQQPARTDRIREEYRRSPEGFEVAPQQRMEAQIISLAA